MQRITLARSFRALTLLLAMVLVVLAPVGARAASAFAHPAFAAQWQQGEAIAPNFWGPLATARDGQQEPYKEAPGGQRLVQYFDKGRMELTNGMLTNGLLATDLVTGQIQIGDATFERKPAPAIPLAGDPDNAGPTYAAFSGPAASLLVPASARVGNAVTTLVAADGTVTDGGGYAGISFSPKIGVYDDVTRHNVLGIFADFRERVGFLTVGYAISEPFRANVRVGGTAREVLVQVFERRVLTYNDANPDAFKVEFGNIGRHSYQWHYGSGPAGVPSCRVDDLRVAAQQDAGAGQRYVTITVTNTGAGACLLAGYPTMQVEDARGQPYATENRMDASGEDAGGDVILQPGQQASAQVHLANFCPQVQEGNALHLRVILPDTGGLFTVPASAPPCLGPVGQNALGQQSFTLISDAARVVRDYYGFISNHEYRSAYALLGASLQQNQSYATFAAGFAATRQDDLHVRAVTMADGRSVVTVGLVAYQTDGSARHFHGTYAVAREDGTLKIVAGSVNEY